MNHTYNIHGLYANDPRSAPTTADEILDGLSPEKLREVCDRAWHDEQHKRAQAAQPLEMEKFFALCPDYDDTDKASADLIVADLMLRGVDRVTANAQDFRESWQRVKAAGFNLKLNKEYLREQREKAVEAAKRRESFDESEAYSIPMDELRRRASGGNE